MFRKTHDHGRAGNRYIKSAQMMVPQAVASVVAMNMGGIAFLHVQICDTKIDDDSGAIGKCINDRARKAGDAVNKCQR